MGKLRKYTKRRAAIKVPAALHKLRGDFIVHRHNAQKRKPPIPFLLSFGEWLQIWVDSGKLSERGRGTQQFCMSRREDQGAYEVGNVRIVTNQENRLEFMTNPSIEGPRRAKISASSLDRGAPSEETRARMSNSQRARHAAHPVSDETRAKISAKNTGRKQSAEEIFKRSAAIRAANKRRKSLREKGVVS